eukprot:COSAG04_NODE_1839_length_5436_cov_6.618887_2_plen_476_part_00
MDFLASEGIDFTHAISGYPLCCPFRGALLSGVYPHKSCPGHEMQMDPSRPTIAQPFRDAGYTTTWLGKWHLDGFQEREGRAAFHEVALDRRGGFDEWLAYENNNSQYDCWVHGHTEDGAEVPPTRLPGYETDVLTDKLLDLVRRRKADGKPFFAAMSAQPPHNPYVAPQEYMAKHTAAAVQLRPNVPLVDSVRERAQRELAGYYAAIENLDANLGRLIETLRELDMLDNTHIVFFADHGDIHGSHGQFMKTAPWEEAIRIPFVIGGGRRYTHATGRNRAPLNHVDSKLFAFSSCARVAVALTQKHRAQSRRRRSDWRAWLCQSGWRGQTTPTSARPGAHTTRTARWTWPRPARGWKLRGRRSPTRRCCSWWCRRGTRTASTGRGEAWCSATAGSTSPSRASRGCSSTSRTTSVSHDRPLSERAAGLWDLSATLCPTDEGQNLAHNSAYAAQRRRCHERLERWLRETGDDFVLPEL